MSKNRTRQLASNHYGIVTNKLMQFLHRKAIIPAKYRIIKIFELLLGEKRIIATTLYGFKVAVDAKDIIQRSILYSRTYEPELAERILQEINPDDYFYDIGANIGYYTLAALSKGANTIAFDPDPLNTDMISFNIGINSFNQEKARIHTWAIGSNKEELDFYRANVANVGLSSFLSENDNYSDKFKVTVYALDHLVKEFSFPYPTVMKIDVEGWESQVLLGATEIFAKTPPRLVFFEADIDTDYNVKDPVIKDFFSKYGYSISRLVRQNGIVEAKENFIAKKK